MSRKPAHDGRATFAEVASFEGVGSWTYGIPDDELVADRHFLEHESQSADGTGFTDLPRHPKSNDSRSCVRASAAQIIRVTLPRFCSQSEIHFLRQLCRRTFH